MTHDEKMQLFFGDLTTTSAARLQTLRGRFNGLPEDYFAFLEEFGSGTVGNSEYAVFETPIRVFEWYEEGSGLSRDIVLLGKNFSFFSLAYDPARDSYIVITPERDIWDHSVIPALAGDFFGVMCDELQFLVDRIEG